MIRKISNGETNTGYWKYYSNVYRNRFTKELTAMGFGFWLYFVHITRSFIDWIFFCSLLLGFISFGFPFYVGRSMFGEIVFLPFCLLRNDVIKFMIFYVFISLHWKRNGTSALFEHIFHLQRFNWFCTNWSNWSITKFLFQYSFEYPKNEACVFVFVTGKWIGLSIQNENPIVKKLYFIGMGRKEHFSHFFFFH